MKVKLLFSFILLTLLNSKLLSQISNVTPKYCIVNHIDESNRSNASATHQFIASSGIKNYTVRLQAYVITNSAGTNGISATTALESLQGLNENFLVQGTQNTIEFIWSEDVITISDNAINDLEIDQNDFFNFNALPSDYNSIDVYFFDKVFTGSNGGAVLGLANNIADGTQVALSRNIADTQIPLMLALLRTKLRTC